MKKVLLGIALVSVLGFSQVALPNTTSAQSSSTANLVDQIAALQAQVQQLLQQVRELQGVASTDAESSTTYVEAETSTNTEVISTTECPYITQSLFRFHPNTREVVALQRFLRSRPEARWPSDVDTTGYFGDLTRQAVINFQRHHGIATTGNEETTGLGLVGPSTRRLISSLCGGGEWTGPTDRKPRLSITSMSPAGGPVGTRVSLTTDTQIDRVFFGGSSIRFAASSVLESFPQRYRYVYNVPESIGGSNCEPTANTVCPLVALQERQVVPGVYPVVVERAGVRSASNDFLVSSTDVPVEREIADIIYYYDADGRRNAGSFTRYVSEVSRSVRWVERIPNGTVFNFREYDSDDSRFFIVDEPRGTRIEIPLRGGQSRISVNNGAWRSLYLLTRKDGVNNQAPQISGGVTPASGPVSTRIEVVTDSEVRQLNFGGHSIPFSFSGVRNQINTGTNQYVYVANVPSVLVDTYECPADGSPCPAYLIAPNRVVEPGEYKITVSNNFGTSLPVTFVVTGSVGNRPPVIHGVSGPSTLAVGQTGTWTVSARDPEGGALGYFVSWGDEAEASQQTQGLGDAFTQTGTFTHTYGRAGTYTIKFTISDESGKSALTSLTVRVGDVSVGQLGLKVYSPIGGEKWFIGEKAELAWGISVPTNHPGLPETAYLVFELLNGPTNGVIHRIAGSSPVRTGNAIFVLGETIVAGDIAQVLQPGTYSLRARLYDSKPCLGFCPGISSAKVLAEATSPSMTVTKRSLESPQITFIAPSSGPVGTAVTLRTNAAVDGVYMEGYKLENVDSTALKTFPATYVHKFTIPETLSPEIIYCITSPCPQLPARKVVTGTYEIVVRNAEGKSDPVKFQVTEQLKVDTRVGLSTGNLTRVGSTVVVYGSSSLIQPDRSNHVLLNGRHVARNVLGRRAAGTSWDMQLAFEVPEFLGTRYCPPGLACILGAPLTAVAGGDYKLHVYSTSDSAILSDDVTLSVSRKPELIMLTPSHGSVGNEISILTDQVVDTLWIDGSRVAVSQSTRHPGVFPPRFSATFKIPGSLPRSDSCSPVSCPIKPPRDLGPGDYRLWIGNSNGVSNSVSFIVTEG